MTLSKTNAAKTPSLDERVSKLLVLEDMTIKEALKRMGLGSEKILFVTDGTFKLLGTLTDGDIRRWILKEGNLMAPVRDVYNKNPRSVCEPLHRERVRKMMLQEKIEVVPVINEQGCIQSAVFWDEIFAEGRTQHPAHLNVPVIIMAGGVGVRLDPFTKIFPKPLIPFGEKPIVEVVMDRFAQAGCRNFYVTVNYKGKMIQLHFEHADCPYAVNFVWESRPSGTAGSLRLAGENLDADDFFVSNCDILIKADYADIFKFHKEHGNDITVVGSFQHLPLPYGVLHMKNGGLLEKIDEKPEYDFLVNTGMYVVRKNVLKHIPPDGIFDFTDLIAQVKASSGEVRIYPVSQDAWFDIGQWQEYRNALKKMES